jgi:hypothetical protein
LRVHLVKLQSASLGHPQPMPEHQEQEATVTGLVADASGRGDQPSYLKSGKVAASCLTGGLSLFGHFSLSWPVHLFVDNYQLKTPQQPL